jgi:hypothetical protein
MVMSPFKLALTAIFVNTVAVSDDIHHPYQVQMNDVSILYPLPKNESEMNGYVTASDIGRGGALLPRDIYSKVMAQTTPVTELYHHELKAVSFRIDPCFANIGPITDATKCKNQLRVIFQPIQYRNGKARAVDGAVHAFYALTRDELITVIRNVIDLRGSYNMGALAVHPILSMEGLLGREATGLRNLLLTYAGKDNLTRFTIFTPASNSARWDFVGFDISRDEITPLQIPTLPSGTTNVTFFAGFLGDLDGYFVPETQSTDNMQLLGNLARASQVSKSEQQAAFDAAIRIENPDKHSPDTIDCASCHASAVTLVLTGKKLGLSRIGNPNVFIPDPQIRNSDMEAMTPVTFDTKLNIHMFSYREAQPMISARTINETATVVSIINQILKNR